MASVHYNTGNSDQTLKINMHYFSPSEGISGEVNNTAISNDRIIAHEMTHAVIVSYYGGQAMYDMPSWFKEGTAEFIPGADERLLAHIGDGLGGVDDTALDNLVARGAELLTGTGADFGKHSEGGSFDYATSYVITKFIYSELSGGNSFSDFMTNIKAELNTAANAKEAIENAIVNNTDHDTFAEFVTAFENDGATYINGLSINPSVDTGSIAGSSHEGNPGNHLTDLTVIDNSLAEAGVISNTFNVIVPDSSQISSAVTFQIGANQGQSITVELKDMRAAALGIAGEAEGTVSSKDGKAEAVYTAIEKGFGVTDGTDNNIIEYALDVSTHERATAAIAIYNDAIEKVSSFRSNLGAYQNRLEHTIANLDNTAENLQAAESRIRDVDMAREIMEMTRANILSQASQAMLAQTNQQPQSILQLLG